MAQFPATSEHKIYIFICLQGLLLIFLPYEGQQGSCQPRPIENHIINHKTRLKLNIIISFHSLPLSHGDPVASLFCSVLTQPYAVDLAESGPGPGPPNKLLWESRGLPSIHLDPRPALDPL